MSAPILVESASTTPHPAGGVVLLVCTAAGPGRLHFPEALARQLFVVTNPTGLTPCGCARASERERVSESESEGARVRAGRVLAPERLAAYERIKIEVAADPRVWGAVTRACARHGIGEKAFYAWRHNCRLRARIAAGRPPLPKPSGHLL